MATTEQIQSLLNLMQQQMQHLTHLQDENSQLRNKRYQPTANIRQPDRPIISCNMDEKDWAVFIDSWQRYKLMTGINDADYVKMELRAACSQEINRLLFEYVGPLQLDQANERELLEHIRAIAVKVIHKEVHRMKFTQMKQMDGEPIMQFIARLKAQASLCQFSVSCCTHLPTPVLISYTDDMVAQQLLAGLANQEFQSKILSESASLPTLASKVDRLRCLEASEESATHFRPSSSVLPSHNSAAQKPQQRKQINRPVRTAERRCRGCGRASHPGKSMRRNDCPAHGKVCNNCGIVGHFSSVCESIPKAEPKSSRASATEHTSAQQPAENQAYPEPSFAGMESEPDFRLGQSQNETR